MKVLIVHKDSLSSKRKREIETALKFLNTYTPLTWEFKYRRDRDLANNLVLEGGDNLDEHAIQEYVNEPDYDFIHLDLTEALWRKLGLRKSLYGQAQNVRGQGITYGRWTQSRSDRVKYLPEHLKFLSEVGLGIVHEIAHCLRFKYKMKYAIHSYFYGYSKRQLASKRHEKPSPRRWVKKPDPDQFYKEVPWEVPKTTQKAPEVAKTDESELIFKGQPAITTIVLHHTAVSRATQTLQFDPVNSFHRNKWNDKSELGYYVGYNFLCEPTGKRYQARKIGEETIAQVGNNCDVSSRCGMVSYCMAGDFRKEKPTNQQVADFRAFIAEVKKVYPNVVVQQHKDVQTGRTCAELAAIELENIAVPSDDSSKDEQIAALKAQVKQLIAMVTTLIKLVTK